MFYLGLESVRNINLCIWKETCFSFRFSFFHEWKYIKAKYSYFHFPYIMYTIYYPRLVKGFCLFVVFFSSWYSAFRKNWNNREKFPYGLWNRNQIWNPLSDTYYTFLVTLNCTPVIWMNWTDKQNDKHFYLQLQNKVTQYMFKDIFLSNSF